MFFLSAFSELQLDIVGIVAILGEASTLRVSQISALSWHHELPRLMPAPQALLKHSLEKRLPIEAGKVVGAYSGNVNLELNFFCQLLHPRELKNYEVEFVTVKKRKGMEHRPPYEVNPAGSLRALSLLGSALSVTLIALSVVYDDGWALIGTLLLSLTSTLVGFASRWKLEVKQPPENRLTKIHDSDVVIFYPRTGAFRIVRCSEFESRLYFTSESCKSLLNDTWYRAFALSGTLTLIFGLISIGNAQTIMQVTFAATYVLLNIAYWLASAIGSHEHWVHSYDVEVQEFDLPPPALPLPPSVQDQSSATRPALISAPASMQNSISNHCQPAVSAPAPVLNEVSVSAKPSKRTTFQDFDQGKDMDVEKNLRRRNTTKFRSTSFQRRYTDTVTFAKGDRIFTTALWEAIALSGTSDWLLRTNIAPKNDVWDKWIRLAGEAARTDSPDCKGTYELTVQGRTKVILSAWPHRQVLGRLFAEEENQRKWRPEWSNRQLENLYPEIVHSAPSSKAPG